MEFLKGDIVYSINSSGIIRKYCVLKLWDTLISKYNGTKYPVYLVIDVKTKMITPMLEYQLYKDKKMAKREYKEAFEHMHKKDIEKTRKNLQSAIETVIFEEAKSNDN